jgi:hypothetical protein
MSLVLKTPSGSERVATTQKLVTNDVTVSATAAQARMMVAMIKRRRVVAMVITATVQMGNLETCHNKTLVK